MRTTITITRDRELLTEPRAVQSRANSGDSVRPSSRLGALDPAASSCSTNGSAWSAPRSPSPCGQCTQCREGTGWLHKLMVSLDAGTATESDLEVIDQVTRVMDGHTICALSDAAAWGSGWFLRRFRQEFEDHVTHAGCPLAGTSFEI